MVADAVLSVRSTRERANSVRLREKAEADVERMREIAADIRRMTRLYVEREQGRR